MLGLSFRELCLSLCLLLPWLGTGCASLSRGFRGPGEITDKARRLCQHNLLAWPDLGRFPADMSPQDYVRPEDLAWLQAHPEVPPPVTPPPAQPGLCEVLSPSVHGDFATVSVKLRPSPEAEADAPPGDILVAFQETPAGWRLVYWLPEEAALPAQASGANIPLFSEALHRPLKLSGADLAYTREALEKGVQGMMAIRCVITRQGSLTHCHTLKPLPFMVQPALEALWGSRYAPAKLDGAFVDVRYTFYFNLRVGRLPPR
ncbi:energy transducer TonB [Corallococcus carmarthensis]|uniref:energy transducer TonB n=1 Tax=Corallococcus carmarthensis TaxID=2316728 RepID=UPI0011C41B07|nr:energy transducer TonB [Corallococcus carmarthensis]